MIYQRIFKQIADCGRSVRDIHLQSSLLSLSSFAAAAGRGREVESDQNNRTHWKMMQATTMSVRAVEQCGVAPCVAMCSAGTRAHASRDKSLASHKSVARVNINYASIVSIVAAACRAPRPVPG